MKIAVETTNERLAGINVEVAEGGLMDVEEFSRKSPCSGGRRAGCRESSSPRGALARRAR
jgi:hypothetical protein